MAGLIDALQVVSREWRKDIPRVALNAPPQCGISITFSIPYALLLLIILILLRLLSIHVYNILRILYAEDLLVSHPGP